MPTAGVLYAVNELVLTRSRTREPTRWIQHTATNPGNLLYPNETPLLDGGGLLEFTGPGKTIVISYTGGAYEHDDNGSPLSGGSFSLYADPDQGQTYPAKYVFDVTAAPSCTSDYVVIGIPANPSGSQANIVRYNELYSGSGTPYCTGYTGPAVMFAYASGSGEVPGSITISHDGTKLAYIEDDLPTSANPNGGSVFHILTIGTSAGSEGTSPTSPVVPGADGSNAVDTTVALAGGGSPLGCTGQQSSTTSPFIDYSDDAAYVTTYSWSGGFPGSGCLYKISPVFSSSGTPAVAWSVPIVPYTPTPTEPNNTLAVPSSPVYDSVTQRVFFSDGWGELDYVDATDPSAGVTPGVLNREAESTLNPPIVDSANGQVYAVFNDLYTAFVDQYTTTFTNVDGSFTGYEGSQTVGGASTNFTGPYNVDFNNAYYTGGPFATNAMMFVVGTDIATGTVPTLYSVTFAYDGTISPYSDSTYTTAALATGTADSSPVTEFYNTTTSTDYLFVGVTNNCPVTEGGAAGCVMSLNITSGAPTVGPSTTAIAATGGSTGIIVDNEADTTAYPQASSVYYGTKNTGTLVKATQSALE